MKKLGYYNGCFMVAFIALMGIIILPALATGEDAIVRGKSQTGISYMTGGVGLEERAVMKKEAESYNLWLEFATKNGNYLSDVDVRIKDEKGAVVLEEKSTGPWFLASLPAGKYMVRVKVLKKGILTAVEAPAEKKITITW